MDTTYVGIGEYTASKTSHIKTMALGSCVAVILQDLKNRTAGLLHVALPDSSINPKRAEAKPGMFVDTGIPKLLEEMKQLGYTEQRGFIVKLAGGASMIDPKRIFNIGQRNILAVRESLQRYHLGVGAEDVGGAISRTVTVDVVTGKVWISSPGRGEWEL